MASDDTVPWMIGGEVKHTVEVGRLVSFVAFGGEEGIVGPKDLEVREGAGASASPTTGVRVFPGACSMLNTGVGAAYDAYAARFPTIINVPIAATGASTRHDMIVARIEDPFAPGTPWDEPTTEEMADETYAFRFIRVISGVGANDKTIADTGLGYVAIPLARIDIPPGTTTITQAMITDLRKLTHVRQADVDAVINPSSASTLPGGTSSVPTNWPPPASYSVDIPKWATHFTGQAILGGVQFGGTGTGGGDGWDVNGALRLQLGTLATEYTNYNLSNDGGADYVTLITGGKVAIPASMRGTTVTFRVQGYKSSGDTILTAGTPSSIFLGLKFTQVPETNL